MSLYSLQHLHTLKPVKGVIWGGLGVNTLQEEVCLSLGDPEVRQGPHTISTVLSLLLAFEAESSELPAPAGIPAPRYNPSLPTVMNSCTSRYIS